MDIKFRFHFEEDKGFVVSQRYFPNDETSADIDIDICGLRLSGIQDIEPTSDNMLQTKPKFTFGHYQYIEFVVDVRRVSAGERGQLEAIGVPAVCGLEDIAALGDSSEVWGKPILLGSDLITVESCIVHTYGCRHVLNAEQEILQYLFTMKAEGSQVGKVYMYDKETFLPTCEKSVFHFERSGSTNWTTIQPTAGFCKFVEKTGCWELIYATIGSEGELYIVDPGNPMRSRWVGREDIKLHLTKEEYLALPKRASSGLLWSFEYKQWMDFRNPDGLRRRRLLLISEYFGRLRSILTGEICHTYGYTSGECVDDRHRSKMRLLRRAQEVHAANLSKLFGHIKGLSEDISNEYLDQFIVVFEKIFDSSENNWVTALEDILYTYPAVSVYQQPVFNRCEELFGEQDVVHSGMIRLVLVDILVEMITSSEWEGKCPTPEEFAGHNSICCQGVLKFHLV